MIQHLAAIQLQAPLRAEIDQQIAQFLAAGGDIQRLSHIERAEYRPTSYNTSITRRRNVHAEFLELERKVAEHGRGLASTGLTVLEASRQLRQRWAGQMSITAPRAEQLAAKYGYVYTVRGKE